GRGFHFDLVRAGIALYGAQVGANLTLMRRLRPALSLKSRVAYVRRVAAGATVGYGRTFTCEREMGLALVSIGYADGVRRALSNRGAVLIRGVRGTRESRARGRRSINNRSLVTMSSSLSERSIASAWHSLAGPSASGSRPRSRRIVSTPSSGTSARTSTAAGKSACSVTR